jgi:hypothetical protein
MPPQDLVLVRVLTYSRDSIFQGRDPRESNQQKPCAKVGSVS